MAGQLAGASVTNDVLSTAPGPQSGGMAPPRPQPGAQPQHHLEGSSDVSMWDYVISKGSAEILLQLISNREGSEMEDQGGEHGYDRRGKGETHSARDGETTGEGWHKDPFSPTRFSVGSTCRECALAFPSLDSFPHGSLGMDSKSSGDHKTRPMRGDTCCSLSIPSLYRTRVQEHVGAAWVSCGCCCTKSPNPTACHTHKRVLLQP